MKSEFGRNAETGRITSVAQAKAHPSTHQVETASSGTTGPTGKIGRHVGSGEFTTVEEAKAHPKTHVVETIKK